VLAVEFIAPWLVLCPLLWPRIRLIGLVLLASLHAAFLLMLHIGLFPLIDFMALSLLIPGTVWVWFKRRRNPEQSQTVLHYDEDCGFCLKMCLILRAFLLPKNVVIQPAQKTASIYEIMQRENSWVVTDAGGQTFIHWHAMAFLFSQRWPFKPGAVVAAAFFYVVTAFNIYEMPGLRGKMPHHVEYTARVLRLDQRWDMFAPFPATESSYPLISGNLRDETPVDLYQLTSSKADWRPPSRYYSLYPSYRWRKYLGRVRSHGNNSVRQALGDYYCRSWNGIERPRAEQLATLEIRFATIVTAPPGSAPNAEKRSMVWRHWCFPEYADKS